MASLVRAKKFDLLMICQALDLEGYRKDDTIKKIVGVICTHLQEKGIMSETTLTASANAGEGDVVESPAASANAGEGGVVKNPSFRNEDENDDDHDDGVMVVVRNKHYLEKSFEFVLKANDSFQDVQVKIMEVTGLDVKEFVMTRQDKTKVTGDNIYERVADHMVNDILIVDIGVAGQFGGGKRGRGGAVKQKQMKRDDDDDDTAPASAGEDDVNEDTTTMTVDELKVSIKADVALIKQEVAYNYPEIVKMVDRCSGIVQQHRKADDLLTELKGMANVGELIGVTATNCRVLSRIAAKLMKVARANELVYLTSMERVTFKAKMLIQKCFMLLYQECYTHGSKIDHKRFEHELLLAFKDDVKREARDEARSSRFMGGFWA
jgi:hypothetical protein